MSPSQISSSSRFFRRTVPYIMAVYSVQTSQQYVDHMSWLAVSPCDAERLDCVDDPTWAGMKITRRSTLIINRGPPILFLDNLPTPPTSEAPEIAIQILRVLDSSCYRSSYDCVFSPEIHTIVATRFVLVLYTGR